MDNKEFFAETKVNCKAVNIDESVSVNDSIRLSDNMPSIRKVLYTDNNAVITGVSACSGILSVKGEIRAKIIYEGENMRPELAESLIPFEYITEISEDNITPILEVKSLSCDVDSSKQRRADLSIKLKIKGVLLSAIPAAGKIKLDNVGGIHTKPVSIKGGYAKVIESVNTYSFCIETEATTPARLVCATCRMAQQNTSTGRGGVLFAGTAEAEVLLAFEDEEGGYTYSHLNEAFSITNLLETNSSDSYEQYSLSTEMLTQDESVVYENNAVSVKLTIEVRFCLILMQQLSLEADIDIYSTEKRLTPKVEQIDYTALYKLEREIIQLSEFANTNIAGVCKAVCPAASLKYEVLSRDKGCEISGELTLNALLMHDNRGSFTAQSLKMPFSKSFEGIKAEELLEKVTVENADIILNGDRINAKADIIINGVKTEKNISQLITDVEVGEYEEKESNFTVIKMHYCKQDEDLWQLAKENRTTVERILSTNQLSDESELKPRKPIMIK